jgi:hypothetical protein
VFISSSVNAGDVAVFSVAATVAVEKVVTAAAAAGIVVVAKCVAVRFSRARAFLAAFFQILSIDVRRSSEN